MATIKLRAISLARDCRGYSGNVDSFGEEAPLLVNNRQPLLDAQLLDPQDSGPIGIADPELLNVNPAALQLAVLDGAMSLEMTSGGIAVI